MEIAGYPILNWLALVVGLGIAGWVTTFPVVWLLTLRTDGKDPGPNNWLVRYRWVVALSLAVVYFILLGNAVGWQFGSSD